MRYVKIEAAVMWTLFLGFVGYSIAAPPATAVAVSHRHTQARTDSQPVLKDDLANQKRDTGNLPEIPDSSPDLGALVGSAIESAVPKSRPVVIYTQTGCAPCRALEKQLSDGVPGAEISYSYDLPAWCESTPAIYLRDVRRVAYGYHSRQQFIDLLERNKPVLIPQAVSVGKLAIRSHVANILSRVEPGGIIRMGSATITLPQTMQPQVRLSRESLVVTFAGEKPRFKYGSGFLAVGAGINGFTLTDSLLTVSVAGLPDVSLEVTP